MTKNSFLFVRSPIFREWLVTSMSSMMWLRQLLRKESSLGYDVRALIDQDVRKLNQTRHTQPAILTASLAIYRLLVEEGVQPGYGSWPLSR